MVFHEPDHEFKELSDEARRPNRGRRVFVGTVGGVFNHRERDRITQFNVAWSYDAAERQHVQSFPFLSGSFYVSLQVTKRHMMTLVRIVGFLAHQLPQLRSTGYS